MECINNSMGKGKDKERKLKSRQKPQMNLKEAVKKVIISNT